MDSVFVVKQSQDMVNKTFRFPQELLDQLERVAREKNVSVNNLVKQCCEYALENLPQDDK
jgi:predicted HicB family RNase H-like nuclease